MKKFWNNEAVAQLDAGASSPRMRKSATYINWAIDRFGNFAQVADEFFKHRCVWLSTVIGLLILQLTLVFTHQPWLDEYQALQIALQSPNFASLLENLRYEGHPPLWYLLLQTTAVIVPPIWVLSTLQAVIAAALQLIILFRAPFNRFEKLLIGSSFFVLIEYGTLSRSLGLGALLLTIFFAYRTHRIAWMAIALLPMADFLFGVLSIGCIAIMGKEKRLWWPGILLWGANGLMAAWSVYPAPDMVPAIQPHDPLLDTMVFLSYLSVQLVPLHAGTGLQWNTPLPVIIAPSLGLFFIWFAIFQMRFIRFHLVLFCSLTVTVAIFCVTIYPLPIRHISLIAYFLIMLKWRECEQKPHLNRSIKFWIFITSLCGLISAVINLFIPFDTSIKAAEYIRRNNLADKHWFSFPQYRAQGIGAILGIEFLGIDRDCKQSFMRWNHRNTIESVSNFYESIENIKYKYGKSYLITNFDVPIQSDLIKKLEKIDPGYNGQSFFIYSIAPNDEEKIVKSLQCPPVRNNIAPLGN